MKKEPFVSIIICTHNRKEALEKLAFKSIQKLDYSNYEVIVVDDASTDGTEKLVKKYQDKILSLRYINNKKNKGLCYVRNLGIKYSKGDIIVFIDDDCYVDNNWLKELVKPYSKDNKIMVVGGESYMGNSKKRYNNRRNIYGCNMSFRKKIFNKFLFDSNLYFNKSSVHDETELIYRIKRKKFKTFYTEKAIVKHFAMPADHRKNFILGGPLNQIYMITKKISLIEYYSHFINYLILNNQKFNKKPDIEKNSEEGFNRLRQILFIEKISYYGYNLYTLFWIYYLLLLKIPIKAKIKNWLEERKIRKNIL